jgi:hypothetical protein
MNTLINPEALAVIAALAVVNNRIVEYVAAPLFQARGWPRKHLLYVALATGVALGLLLNVELFIPGLFVSVWVGRVITAILIGGGASLLHDVFSD